MQNSFCYVGSRYIYQEGLIIASNDRSINEKLKVTTTISEDFQNRVKEVMMDLGLREKDHKVEVTTYGAVLKNIGLGTMCLAVALIATDHLFHTSRPFLKWRVKQSLKKKPYFKHPKKLISNEKVEAAIFNGIVQAKAPTVIIGPVGCGKSTLLDTLMQKYYYNGHGYVKFISIFPTNVFSKTEYSKKDIVRMNEAALTYISRSILLSIDYPMRPSVWSEFRSSSLINNFTSIFITSKKVDLSVHANNYFEVHSHKMLMDGLSLLFSSASEIYESTGYRPLIVFDDLQYLFTKADRQHFSCNEAKELFHFIANQAYYEGYCEKRVNVLFCGSSSGLTNTLDDTLLSGSRRNDIYLEDFSKKIVVDYLINAPFFIPEKYASMYIDRVGTRLRFMDLLVEQSTHLPEIKAQLEEVYRMQRSCVVSMMSNPKYWQYFTQLAASSQKTPILFENMPSEIKINPVTLSMIQYVKSVP